MRIGTASVLAGIALFAVPALAGDLADALSLDASLSAAADLERPGMAYYHTPGTSHRNDFSLGLHPTADGGYWMLGLHADPPAVPSDIAVVARLSEDGAYDAGFGGGGVVALQAFGPNGKGIVVATRSREGRSYFAGLVERPEEPGRNDLGVFCVEADGTPCLAFGEGGSRVVPIDDAVLTQASGIAVTDDGRVIVPAGCKVAGIHNPLGNLDVCVAALDGVTGEPDAAFGNEGVRRVGVDLVEDGWDIPAAGTSLLLTDGDSPYGSRIFICGAIQVTPWSESNPFAMLDDRAFVLALRADTGEPDSTYGDGGHLVVYDDGKNSYLTAMSLRRDGALLFAGEAATDNPSEFVLLLGARAGDGTPAADVCGGEICVGNPGGIAKLVPRAVLERPPTRDLVVAAETAPSVSVAPIQSVLEFGANGTVLRSIRHLDYSAAPDQEPTGSVKGMSIDAEGRVVVVGERRWATDPNQPIDQYDMTLARLVDTDSVFSDGFEE